MRASLCRRAVPSMSDISYEPALQPDHLPRIPPHAQARVVAEVGRALDVAARQADACREAADQLAFLHGELEDGRAPAYDVHSALEVLQTGARPRCPVLCPVPIVDKQSQLPS